VSISALHPVNGLLTMQEFTIRWGLGCLYVQLRGDLMATFGDTLADVEREHILTTLKACDGNRTRTAKLLGISVRCLRMKLHQFQSGGMLAVGVDSFEGLGWRPRHRGNTL